MTSVTSKVPDLLAYLVTLFSAADTLGAADPPVTVFDGTQTTEDDPPLTLWVGLDDPDSDSAPLAATSDRQWNGLDSQSELITVFCVAESWSGGDDVIFERTAAYGIVAAAEELVRGDASQFGIGASRTPGVTGSQLRQNNTNRGAQARVSFQIVLTVL